MSHKHLEEIPVAIESLVSNLGELEIVLGARIAPTINAVRTTLIAAMAARDRGDVAAAVAEVADAMDRLTALADQLDPAEGLVMRALARSFRSALMHGDEAQAREAAAVMLNKSGAVERKKQ